LRVRNRRGEGERLRTQLLAAAVDIVESQNGPLSLRGVARHVGVATTSVYLHFPDVEHLLAAVMQEGFDRLSTATSAAAESATDAADELRIRCRAYCRFGVDHPGLYSTMFQAGLPTQVLTDPAQTPGRRSFENLVAAVRRCIEAGLAPAHGDPFRLASLIWAADHGLILTRVWRPTFPWAPLDDLVDEMVNRLMGIETGSED
jgi:AcrR family transcriptional regulator